MWACERNGVCMAPCFPIKVYKTDLSEMENTETPPAHGQRMDCWNMEGWKPAGQQEERKIHRVEGRSNFFYQALILLLYYVCYLYMKWCLQRASACTGCLSDAFNDKNRKGIYSNGKKYYCNIIAILITLLLYATELLLDLGCIA